MPTSQKIGKMPKNSTNAEHISNAYDIYKFICSIKATTNFGGGTRQIYRLGAEDKYPRCIGYFKQHDNEAIFNRVLELFFTPDANYYITKNSFTCNRRKNEFLFSFDNIAIDIDKHPDPKNKGEKLDFNKIDRDIDRLVALLDAEYKDKFPEYNVVRTGRGVQLWIGLQSCYAQNPTNRRLYDYATNHFIEFMKGVLEEHQIDLQVDEGATRDIARILRLPYTYNQHRKGFKAYFKRRTDKKYDLQTIAEEFGIEIPVLEEQKATNKAKSSSKGTNKKKTRSNKAKKSSAATGEARKPKDSGGRTIPEPIPDLLKPMAYKRLALIDKVVADNKGRCTGRRNNILLVYYSSAVIVMDRSEAKERTFAMNERFTEPLSEADVNKVFKSADSDCKGRMYFKNKTVLEMVGANGFERLTFGVDSAREIERATARKKKAERNARIVELSEQGMSLRAIAEELGIAVNTVRSALKKAESDVEAKSEPSVIEEHSTTNKAETVKDKSVGSIKCVVFRMPDLNELSRRVSGKSPCPDVALPIDDS